MFYNFCFKWAITLICLSVKWILTCVTTSFIWFGGWFVWWGFRLWKFCWDGNCEIRIEFEVLLCNFWPKKVWMETPGTFKSFLKFGQLHTIHNFSNYLQIELSTYGDNASITLKVPSTATQLISSLNFQNLHKYLAA